MMAEKKLSFSEVGEAGLKEMLTTCANCYYYAIEAFMEEVCKRCINRACELGSPSNSK